MRQCWICIPSLNVQVEVLTTSILPLVQKLGTVLIAAPMFAAACNHVRACLGQAQALPLLGDMDVRCWFADCAPTESQLSRLELARSSFSITEHRTPSIWSRCGQGLERDQAAIQIQTAGCDTFS